MSFRATNDLSGPRPRPADPAARTQRTAPIALLVFAGLLSWATPLARVEAAPLSGFIEGRSTRRTTSPARVVILSQEICCPAQVWRAAEQRIAAELRAGGFVTETSSSTVFGKDRARARELAEVGTRLGAVAALTVLRRQGGTSGTVHVWLAGSSIRRARVQHFPLTGKLKPSAAALAQRLVKTLRSQGLRDAPRSSAASGAGAHRKTSDTFALSLRNAHRVGAGARRQGRGPWDTGPWAVRVEVGMRGNSVSEYVLMEARATATFQPHRNAALDLSLFSSLWGDYEYLSDGGISHTHRLGYAGGRLTARWVIVSGGRWRPSIGVTAGPIYIYTREQQLGSEIAEHHGFWAADVSATAQLAFGVTRTFWVRLSAEVGNLFPSRDISFPWITQDHPNPRVASFGRPFMWSAGLAFELKIP